MTVCDVLVPIFMIIAVSSVVKYKDDGLFFQICKTILHDVIGIESIGTFRSFIGCIHCRADFAIKMTAKLSFNFTLQLSSPPLFSPYRPKL